MRAFYPKNTIDLPIFNKIYKMIKNIKENISTYISITGAIIHAILTVLFVVIAYEKQQINLQAQLNQLSNTSKVQIESIKDYVDSNITTINFKISQQQENNDKIYGIQVEQNKEINNKLDLLNSRLDSIITKNNP